MNLKKKYWIQITFLFSSNEIENIYLFCLDSLWNNSFPKSALYLGLGWARPVMMFNEENLHKMLPFNTRKTVWSFKICYS